MPELNFKGKQHIYAHHLMVPYRPLVPDFSKSVLPESAEQPPPDDNLIIQGDNLHALKALLPRYAGRVNCIYIDPPYNTGNEGWIYNDNVNSPLMRKWIEENGPVDNEDMERHDKWLCMMWPRLHLLKELLTEDGIIYVSIDDNEQHHLRMVMDEIFGEQNFFARLTWESRTKPTNMGKARFNIQSNTESVLVYGKMSMTDHTGFRLYDTTKKKYSYQDDRGKYRLEEFQQRRNLGSLRRNTMIYSIEGIMPKDGYRWQVSPGEYEKLQNKNNIVIDNNKVFKKVYEVDEDSFSYEPFWSFISKDAGTTEKGKSDLNNILGLEHGMETVKPVELIQKIIYHSTDQTSIILDSFAGSGTTAHAVMALNKQDGGDRKYILVECEDYADNITAERVRRVIDGVPNSNDKTLRDGLGDSFTFCTLGDPIDIDSMLRGEHLPSYSDFASYLLHTASGISVGSSVLKPLNDDGLFHSDDRRCHYLIYKPEIEFLKSNEAMVDEKRAQRISDSCGDKKAVVFAPGKFMRQHELSDLNIVFCQIPLLMNGIG